MPRTVVDLHFAEIERRNTFEAGDVDPELIGVRAPLVVSVDAADRAEIMLGDAGVEAVGCELVRTLGDPEALWR